MAKCGRFDHCRHNEHARGHRANGRKQRVGSETRNDDRQPEQQGHAVGEDRQR